MTETDGVLEPAPDPGTVRHFEEFLEWAARTGELPRTTVGNWRVAANQVLEIESDDEPNLVTLDLEGLFSRFATLNKTKYSKGSLAAYRSRFRAAIESYRRWIADDPAWKPVARVASPRGPIRSKAAPVSAGPAPRRPGPAANRSDGPAPEVAPGVPLVAQSSHEHHMIEYPLPIRRGVRARLMLPEDLTTAEAERIAKFVNSLAFDEPEPEPQL